MLNELKDKLAVDKDSLDEELVQQPALLHAIHEAYEDALADRDDYKEQLTTLEAALDLEFRTIEPKPTETALKSMVQIDERRQKLYRQYALARHKVGELGALKDAYKDKSHMLRELCGLYLAKYYEQNSVKATAETDNAVYKRQRQRLAEGRR
jgi:hypothetical protein